MYEFRYGQFLPQTYTHQDCLEQYYRMFLGSHRNVLCASKDVSAEAIPSHRTYYIVDRFLISFLPKLQSRTASILTLLSTAHCSVLFSWIHFLSSQRESIRFSSSFSAIVKVKRSQSAYDEQVSPTELRFHTGTDRMNLKLSL